MSEDVLGAARGTFEDFQQLDPKMADILRRRAESLAAEPEQEAVEQRMQILTFSVGEEWYAVDIDSVQEIHSEYRITSLPSVPRHILGVINIRGEITSVTDFRRLLDLPETGETEAPVIVVGDSATETALVVDAIGDILEVAKGGVEPPLSVMDKRHVEYVEGSVAADDRLIAIVNLRKVLEPIGGSS
jgi:purine-binding chemotaxis protein CheW